MHRICYLYCATHVAADREISGTLIAQKLRQQAKKYAFVRFISVMRHNVDCEIDLQLIILLCALLKQAPSLSILAVQRLLLCQQGPELLLPGC